MKRGVDVTLGHNGNNIDFFHISRHQRSIKTVVPKIQMIREDHFLQMFQLTASSINCKEMVGVLTHPLFNNRKTERFGLRNIFGRYVCQSKSALKIILRPKFFEIFKSVQFFLRHPIDFVF